MAAISAKIYSHHQKFLVVDREIAFVGGLDLTSNRYGIPIAGDEGRLKRIKEKEIVERMGGESRGW